MSHADGFKDVLCDVIFVFLAAQAFDNKPKKGVGIIGIAESFPRRAERSYVKIRYELQELFGSIDGSELPNTLYLFLVSLLRSTAELRPFIPIEILK